MTRSGPAPAVAGNRAQDAAATTPHNVTCQSSADDDREAHQRERKALVQDVMDGEGHPLDRLRTAARRGRQLIAAGGPRVALSAAPTATAEAAGVARSTTEKRHQRRAVGCSMNRGQREQLSRRLRSWAHGYARRGWPVFALAEGTNVPALSTSLGGHGFRDATCDPDLVDQLWSWFPLGNVGVATGEAAGLSVLDVDPRNGGDQTLAALVAERGPLPAGPTVSTPSGGRHHYFRWRPGMSCSVGQLGPGLDVRTDGGYVCAPPSVRPDGRYAWATDPRTPLADWPEWLLPPTRDPALSNLRPPRPGVKVDAGRALAGLVRTVAEAPQGTRNRRLFWAGCRLAKHASAGRLPLDVGAAALLAAAAEAGLSEAEANRTLGSALRRAVAA